MSLDVYLHAADPFPQDQTPKIFVREDGQTRQITRAEWDVRHPDDAPVMVRPAAETTVLYHDNITHNLCVMAQAVGLYAVLWQPETVGITHAAQARAGLEAGLGALRADPEGCRALAPANGWGTYAGLVRFVVRYLAACEIYPEARIEVWR